MADLPRRFEMEVSSSSSESDDEDELDLANMREEEAEAVPVGSFCGCYLLRSLENARSRATYVGFTVNPLRRIRQHNGLIKGGARKTKSKRPWAFVALVHGFQSQVEALQFEWAWQHPKISRVVREAHPGLSRPNGWKAQLEVLAVLLSADRYKAQNLEVRVADPSATPVPPRLGGAAATLTTGPIPEWHPAQVAAKPNAEVAPLKKAVVAQQQQKGGSPLKKKKLNKVEIDRSCALCGGNDDPGAFHTCKTCHAEAHIRCLADHFAKASKRGGRTTGSCPLCGTSIRIKLIPPPQQQQQPSDSDESSIVDLTGGTPSSSVNNRVVLPSSRDTEDSVVDLCTPSPLANVTNTPGWSSLRPPPTTIASRCPAAELVFTTNRDVVVVDDSDDDDDDDDDSIIDLTKTVRKSSIFGDV